MTSNVNLLSTNANSGDQSTRSKSNQHTKEEHQYKPGIYAISKASQSYNADYRRNHRITVQSNRVVVICDGIHKDPASAAEDAVKWLRKMNVEPAATLGSFDIFYPGYIGSLGDYDSVKISQIHEAAILLANALKTVSRDWAFWIALYGGSALFAQSMEILIKQNITLKNQIAKLYKPTISSVIAVRMVHQLGMNMPTEFSKAGGLLAYTSLMRANLIRARYENDSYTWADYARCIVGNRVLGASLIGIGLLMIVLLAIWK